MFARGDRGACGAVEGREGVAEEAFAGDAGEQRLAERGELGKAAQQRVVRVLYFAEAEAGVEDDAFRRDAGCEGCAEPLGELALDQRQDFLAVRAAGATSNPMGGRARASGSTPQWRSAQVAAMASSQSRPLTSLTISAPAAMAARAVAAW